MDSPGHSVLVVDDEPDVEALFRQQFRRDLRADAVDENLGDFETVMVPLLLIEGTLAPAAK